MNMPRPLAAASSILLALLLAACGTPPADDPYADPGTEPPAPIENPTVATSGSLSPRGDSDLVDINVAGFLAPEDEAALRTAQVADLTEGDFTVVEAGVVQGITVERIGEGANAQADVVFVIDTTASMSTALTSVQDSINGFVDHLAASGLEVRVGAVTYGDAFDTIAADSTSTGVGSTAPPAFDPYERPVYPLTADFEAFQTFIANTDAPGGSGSPENGVGALAFAHDELDWREGAQRIMIVITGEDAYDHENYGGDSIEGRWIPEDPADLLARLDGRASVHVVATESPTSGYVDMAMFTGTEGTGGVFVPFESSTSEPFDLTEFPIMDAAGGYVVTFRGERDGEPKDVRVVIDDGSDIRGEFTLVDSVY